MELPRLTIFVGYDPSESVAAYTLMHSITYYASRPVSIVPLNIRNLRLIFERPRDPKQSNEFSFTRFLVPFLMGYDGWAIFMDCDMLLREDIYNVFMEIENQENKALYVVKHDYVSKVSQKYLQNIQYSYPRKNWSSFVLWNCKHYSNRRVTNDWVMCASGLELHRFSWLKDDEIGELNKRWNWLVGEFEHPPKDVANVHWTLGGPYFDEFKDAEFSSEWYEMRNKMTNCDQI
jgi:hypothetical protein